MKSYLVLVVLLFSGVVHANTFTHSPVPTSGINSGDVTIGTFGAAPDAKGLTVSGQVLTLQPADATRPGGVSITTQSFLGAKTFLNTLTCSLCGFVSTVASGSNAFGVSTNGARIDYGAGANDYASSDGTTVAFAGPIAATSVTTALVTTTATSGNIGMQMVTGSKLCLGASTGCIKNDAFSQLDLSEFATAYTNGANFVARTVGSVSYTCAANQEGLVVRDNASGGTNSGHRTRICICTSDGAASPAYAFQNMVTGTVGTTTSCAD